MKTAIITLAKLLITGLFFFYIFNMIDFNQFADTIRGVRPGLIAAALAAIWLGHLVCVVRWRILMRLLMQTPGFLRLCGIYCIGMFFNLTFPTLIGGDVVKIYYAGKQSRSYAESFASIFLDRDIGMFVMMAIACCAALFHPVSVPGIPVTLILWSVFILFLIGNIALFTPGFHRLLLAALRKHKLEKIAAKIDNVSRAFRTIGGHPAAILQSLGISALNQLFLCMTAWIVALCLGVNVSPAYFLIFVPLITLISMIPISLNGMGLREYSFMALFGGIGVAGEYCIAMGLLHSLMVIMSSLPGGVVYIFFRGKADSARMIEIGSGA